MDMQGSHREQGLVRSLVPGQAGMVSAKERGRSPAERKGEQTTCSKEKQELGWGERCQAPS